MAEPSPSLSRREQYALATRQAILDAARKLFWERGYFATKVDDVAAEAGVAPATVYAVVGGKAGMLRELTQMWVTEPAIDTTLRFVRSANDPREVILYLAHASRTRREQFGDVMHILLVTAPHDSGVAEHLRPATERYRATTVIIAKRLARLGGLRADIDAAYAADVLWFYFGYSSYFTLHDDNGWNYEQAEHWLAEQACRELLEPGPVKRKLAGRHRMPP
jgi:AcrR family transcriptional regulator